jgi:hypothetical protein
MGDHAVTDDDDPRVPAPERHDESLIAACCANATDK